MALRDFFRGRRQVVIGRRRFLVGRPTCESVAMLQEMFWSELMGCRMAYRSRPDLFAADPVGLCLPFFRNTEAIATILCTCVELSRDPDAELEEILSGSRETCEGLIREIVATTDENRVIAFLGIDEAIRDVETPTGKPQLEDLAQSEAEPSPLEMIVGALSLRYHMDPREIMGWPVEMVMSLSQEILPRLFPRDSGDDIFGLSRSEWAAQGYTVVEPETRH